MSGVAGIAADAAQAARSAASAAGAASPRAVTRGESHQQAETAKVDWLNCTFPTPSLSPQGVVLFLGRMLGRPVSGTEGRGMFGFQTGLRLMAYLRGSMVDVGWLCYGGESQRGRWLLQLTGKGCGLVQDWAGLRDFLEGLEARLTRVDLAVDFLDGAHTVDDAVQMHRTGGFTNGGRPPQSAVDGDWLEGIRGRTLYIGKATNGKLLRVYEKGKQLGDLESPWVRYEVQLGNRDREIPFEALTEPTAFFAGCYPCLQELVADQAERIATTQTEAKTTLAHLAYHLKRSYGKLLHTLLETVRVADSDELPHTDLVTEFRVIGTPRRVNPSGVVAGVQWADLKAQLRRKVFS
jgi:phage replication initiation protein